MEPSPSEQAALFSVEEEDAYLLPRAELEKRYTADQVTKIERLRNAVVMLLPMWPVKIIAERVGMNVRTVSALNARESEKVASSKKEFVEAMRSTAARWMALARMKEGEANLQQLMVGVGILMDKALALESTGLMGEEKVVKEQQDRLAGAAALRDLLAQVQAEEQGQSPGGGPVGTQTDAQSAVLPLNTNELRDCRAVDGAVEGLGGRGGSAAAAGQASPTGPAERGFAVKGSASEVRPVSGEISGQGADKKNGGTNQEDSHL